MWRIAEGYKNKKRNKKNKNTNILKNKTVRTKTPPRDNEGANNLNESEGNEED
jgi:hypothetical protein